MVAYVSSFVLLQLKLVSFCGILGGVTDRYASRLFEAFQARLGMRQMRKPRLGQLSPGPAQAVPAGQSPTAMFRAPVVGGVPKPGKQYKPRKPMSILTNPTSIKVGGV